MEGTGLELQNPEYLQVRPANHVNFLVQMGSITFCQQLLKVSGWRSMPQDFRP